VSDEQQVHPFVADVRWAAGAVRAAVDSALAGVAPLSTCRECRQAFYFLAATGLVATTEELCPKCEPEVHRTEGLALEQHAVDQAVADRRGLLSVAHWVASDRRCALADAVHFMERVETGEEPFRQMLALARRAAADPVAVWRAAYLAWSLGLAAAATMHPVAAQMARLAVTQRPDAVIRCVVRARGEVLYDGPVDPDGKCGATIRKGEDEHGRKLLVTCHLADGRKVHRRGERETAPENRFDDTALGGARTMLAEARAKILTGEISGQGRRRSRPTRCPGGAWR
jgi:hypothetical protein